MGGQMQQNNAASASLYDQPVASASNGDDAGDAVMARWLQSAGLQHLGSPYASSGADNRLLPNLLMQGYGAQDAEEKQRLFRLMRNLNFGGDSGLESYTPTDQSSGYFAPSGNPYLSEFRGDFGAGLLDLHALDDTELLSEDVMYEPSGPSPPITDAFHNDLDFPDVQPQEGQLNGDMSTFFPTNDKESSTRENNVAKIRVVVRKRPLNKKELSRKEDDVVTVQDSAYLTVHEPKLKVDLTAYVEKHEFCFDAVLDENVTNDEVYRTTVGPIIPTIFQRTKATCFAYGQTGSGKTYTMQPLPLRAVEDILRLLNQPLYQNQSFKLWLSFFEIYGGKLFDLLSDRKKLCMREDGRQQVCIVGLQEFEVSDVQIVKDFIERGNADRSTGSTGANEESSRSHAILQLVVKKHSVVKDTKRSNDANASRIGKVVGKISFIDLAGSERGADTTDNDRQTRIEGAEINKSLLALKECIRALDNDQLHIPFRGSKLTEVLRDSFVGNSKTVMISCISPNAGSCEHTLNTLRYADRVKSLSKGGNTKKEQGVNSVPPIIVKEPLTAQPLPVFSDVDDTYQQLREPRGDVDRRTVVERDSLYKLPNDPDKLPSNYPPNYSSNDREDSGVEPTGGSEKEKIEKKVNHNYTSSPKMSSMSYATPADATAEKVPPPRQKTEKPVNRQRKEGPSSDISTTSYRQHTVNNSNLRTNDGYRQNETGVTPPTDGINEILEEEEALIAAHRKEIEDTMEIVREEMKLLAEVDQPGSVIDNYLVQLSFLLSRKATNLVSLQARLSRFQHRLKEQEILSRKRVPR
ncbi:hypothetical protein Leryth_025541 [Lithospermum erythrorhizon]|nr:hypothetical protein Leryth_025541 [Lithospermum erythrorhizon]